MAKEILVGRFLTDEMVEEGRALVEKARKSQLGIVGAFWLYFDEVEEWRLVLVSTRLNEDGPLALYTGLDELIYDRNKGDIFGISLTNTTFMDAGDNLARSLASVPHGGQTLDEKRLAGFAFKGRYVSDIYIYFIGDDIRPLPGTRSISK